jgi:hypothetical protein
MNLTMDALRWVAVKAIRGRTWAGLAVYDSPGEPADLRMETERAPFIGVFTDDADFDLNAAESAGVGSLYDNGGKVYLVLEVSVAGQLTDVPERDPARFEGEGGDAPVDADPIDPDMDVAVRDRGILAATDAALEARIGFIARQAVDALCAPDNPWAQLFLQCAPGRGRVEVRRGGSGHDPDQPTQAVRFASRIIRMECDVIGEPVRGEDLPADGFWSQFLALAAQDADLSELASIVSDHLEGVDAQPWMVDQRRGMLTDRGLRGIGIGPALQRDKETPLMQGVDLLQDSADE